MEEAIKIIMKQENCSAVYALYILSKIRKNLQGDS